MGCRAPRPEPLFLVFPGLALACVDRRRGEAACRWRPPRETTARSPPSIFGWGRSGREGEKGGGSMFREV
eukprot:scaffold117790_cov18-Tisochrysis_lutea.AAC.1